MNIRINLPQKKSTNILANDYIHPKYSNIIEYQNICLRLSWTNLAIPLFFVWFLTQVNHFGPLLTILNHFCYHRYWPNEYPNIFVSKNRSQMNIEIYLAWKKLINIKTNKYICQTIFEYILISKYASHTGLWK